MTRTLALLSDSRDDRRRSIASVLERLGCEVRLIAGSGATPGETLLRRARLAVIALPPSGPQAACDAITGLRARFAGLWVLVVVDHGSEDVAVAALRAGVRDYFRAPLDLAHLEASARRCLESADGLPATSPHTHHRVTASAQSLLGVSAPMRKISDYLAHVAERDATVLLTGETGTGKELVASLIHDLSPRRKARFVPINCAAIPEGLLESELFGYERGAFTGAVGRREGLIQAAQGGTVFLDEVADMAAQGQAKILRTLETREVYRVGSKHPDRIDVRYVAATNQDLERAVEEGRFRKDLYYRLAVVRVHLPPLRARRADIGLLLDHYLDRLNPRGAAAAVTLADETRATLQAYDWPGNVRELKNLVESIFVNAPVRPLGLADLPEAFQQNLRRVMSSGGAERRRLMDALLAAHGNKSRAAQLLHWSRMTVYRKMAKYSVSPNHEVNRRQR